MYAIHILMYVATSASAYVHHISKTVSQSVCPFVCPSVCPSVHPSNHPSACTYMHETPPRVVMKQGTMHDTHAQIMCIHTCIRGITRMRDSTRREIEDAG